ncbi:Acyl-coenzyme A oxidase-like protein [Galemys pyrenaicus]|uniref:Acyl-coenzyme A oxidase-like protein n=1 Tax=Galemys pyrenaicus TaxID=202257 RepID=A0A8J5ZU50_GALPY|nr:Acyl-coenzyme A oxidase-like protein [Galemys pyrenaicus]
MWKPGEASILQTSGTAVPPASKTLSLLPPGGNSGRDESGPDVITSPSALAPLRQWRGHVNRPCGILHMALMLTFLRKAHESRVKKTPTTVSGKCNHDSKPKYSLQPRVAPAPGRRRSLSLGWVCVQADGATESVSSRRQFGPKAKEEVKIIEHQTQTLRLMPHLATALALTFTSRYAGALLDEDIFQGKELISSRPLQALVAGLKAYSTWENVGCLQDCRECTGGMVSPEPCCGGWGCGASRSPGCPRSLAVLLGVVICTCPPRTMLPGCGMTLVMRCLAHSASLGACSKDH